MRAPCLRRRPVRPLGNRTGLRLGIGEESVRTYRKRTLKRLNLGSQRELMMWYFDLRDESRG